MATSLLLLTLLLPLAGAVVPGRRPQTARNCALVATLLTLLAAGVLVLLYPAGGQDFAATDVPWVAGAWPLEVHFSIALDGLSLWLFALTPLLVVVAVLVEWEAVPQQPSLYYRLLLVLQAAMLGVFVARDVIVFFVFWQVALSALLLLVGVWGNQGRQQAATKSFLFTLTGSMLTLLGLLVIVSWDFSHPIGNPGTWKATFSIPELTDRLTVRPMELAAQFWVFTALFAGLAIQAAIFPLHTWLPLVQAPLGVGLLLLGVLLKIGAYGLLRFGLPMLPQATASLMPGLLWLAAAGALYGALMATAQTDLRRLVAYWTVGQLGLCMLGVFCLNRLGGCGAVLQMVSHGLSAGGLLALAAMVHRRHGTWQIAELTRLVGQTPLLALFALLIALSAVGVAGLSGFVGQLLLLLGAWQRGDWAEATTPLTFQYRAIAVLAVAAAAVAALYILYLVCRALLAMVRRPKDAPGPQPIRDLTPREVFALTPLVLLALWIGLQPQFFLARISPTLDCLTAVVQQAADPAN
jgi:NADH-quinone oxidoreductase subunit M